MTEKFERIFNTNHPDLLQFRKNAVIECGGRVEDLMLSGPHSQIIETLCGRGIERTEDIYKFTDAKWSNTRLDHVDAYYCGEEIACIAGAKIYGQWIRGAMFYFGLHCFRAQHDSAFFRNAGGLDRLKIYAHEHGLAGVFISIYPHEPRLATLCKRMRENRGIPTAGNINSIRDLKYRGNCEFNNVPQDFFAVEFDSRRFDPAEIVN